MVVSGCCVVIIVKGFLYWKLSFCYKWVIFIHRGGIGWVGSTCSCRRFYATIDTEGVWSQKQELGFPRLISLKRVILNGYIRTCTKSEQFVSSSKSGFSNFMYYAGLHSLLIQRVAMEMETCSSKGTCWGATHAESTF